MRRSITFNATIILLAITSNSLLAQVDSMTVYEIRSYIHSIDSLSYGEMEQRGIVNSIEEGTVRREIVSTTARHTGKVDTIRKQIQGGFGIYTTETIKGDTVFKIKYHDNIDKNFYETYYYKDNKLIYSKIDYQENGIGKTFYYREEYYYGDRLISVNESALPSNEAYRQRVAFNLLKAGMNYLQKHLRKD